MDGARLLNACVATGIAAREMASGWDSAWIDFSKGLGAPIGGVIAGSRDFIDEVWRWKQRLGGSMRQAGICAAACLYALDHHVDRLADDHAHARALARGLSQIGGIEVQQPETNLVFFKPDGAGVAGDKMVEALAQSRRAARDDGRPDQGLHPSRRHHRHDRADARAGTRDRAGRLNLAMPIRTLSSRYAPLGAGPESITTIGSSIPGSRSARPGMTRRGLARDDGSDDHLPSAW